MVRKYSQRIMNKKEALRHDQVELKRKDFCFPGVKTNKAVMTMSFDCRDMSPQHASITVNYYNDDQKVIESVMQPCGDVYVTNYNNEGIAERTVCVNPNCKEGILLTADDMQNLSDVDEKTRFAKRVSSQSIALWKGYAEGKYLTDNEKKIVDAHRYAGRFL